MIKVNLGDTLGVITVSFRHRKDTTYIGQAQGFRRYSVEVWYTECTIRKDDYKITGSARCSELDNFEK